MNRVSALDIRQSHTSEKVRSDLRSHLWAYLVLRPISFYVTPLFVNLGLSANAVTALSLITLVCGLIFILSGATSPINFVIGATLINIVYLLDCVDGNIARFRGKNSKFGALFDSIVGLAFSACLPLSLGLGFYLASAEQVFLPLGLELPGWSWLAAGAVQSSSRLFRRVVSLKSQSGVENSDGKQEGLNISIWAVLPRAIPSFESPLLLLASLVGALGPFLLGFAIYDLVSLIAVIVLSLRRALQVDGQRFDTGENHS
jgi:hypothetical protein